MLPLMSLTTIVAWTTPWFRLSVILPVSTVVSAEPGIVCCARAYEVDAEAIMSALASCRALNIMVYC